MEGWLDLEDELRGDLNIGGADINFEAKSGSELEDDLLCAEG